MRIAHVGLCSHFTENVTYQDNQLSAQNVADGHEVLYISSADRFENGVLVPTGYEDKLLSNGVHLVRLPYVHIINDFISDKVRKVRGLYQLIENFKPDVILCHGQCYWSVLDVVRYKRNHPEIKLYTDTHTAADNSGANWLSLHVLHRIFYRYLVQRLLPYIERYFYIGSAEKAFAIENYGVSESIMEFYPLGGEIPSEEAYAEARTRRRMELGVASDELLLIHSGKLEPKKKTEELLRAFAAVPELKTRLAVIGSIPDNMKDRLIPLMEADKRVNYLGWRSAEELLEYLCACDLYVQPGKVSATMQNAVCCGCPILSYPHRAYTEAYDYGNFIWAASEEELSAAFRTIAAGGYNLSTMREGSRRCARELLDYRRLAARLYQ